MWRNWHGAQPTGLLGKWSFFVSNRQDLPIIYRLLVLLVLQEPLHLVNVYMGYNYFYLPCILYHLSINSRPQNVGWAYFWPAVLLLQTLVEYCLRWRCQQICEASHRIITLYLPSPDNWFEYRNIHYEVVASMRHIRTAKYYLYAKRPLSKFDFLGTSAIITIRILTKNVLNSILWGKPRAWSAPICG